MIASETLFLRSVIRLDLHKVNSLGPEVNNNFRRLRLDMTGRLHWPGAVCHPAGGRWTKARPATAPGYP